MHKIYTYNIICMCIYRNFTLDRFFITNSLKILFHFYLSIGKFVSDKKVWTNWSVFLKLFIKHLKCNMNYKLTIYQLSVTFIFQSRLISVKLSIWYTCCGKTKVGFKIELTIIEQSKSLYILVLKSFISLAGLKCITCFLLLYYLLEPRTV